MWARLVELWRESVLMQSLITLVVLVTVAIMELTGRPITDHWWGVVGLIIGYYFGSDRAAAVRRALSIAKGGG